MVVLPGLINCYTHVPQILLRGYSSNQHRGVWDWLTNVVHPGLWAWRLSPNYWRPACPLAVGTDDVNCNGTVNLLSDMKILALVHRALTNDPSTLPADQVLEMATVNGARAVGMESEIGSIEAGKRADIILVDLRHAQMTPTHLLPSALVFQTYGNEVDTVLIEGDVVMRNRRLTWLTAAEERALYREAAERSTRISRRAGIRAHWTSSSKGSDRKRPYSTICYTTLHNTSLTCIRPFLDSDPSQQLARRAPLGVTARSEQCYGGWQMTRSNGTYRLPTIDYRLPTRN